MTGFIVASLREFFGRSLVEVVVDMADIAIVAFILYRGLLLIKGTRAMQMAVGMAFVFLVYDAARRIGLVTLFTMLDTVLGSIVIVAVVLFQHDIRRALMRFGRRPFLKSARSAQETHVIEEVVRAATSLAQRRIGALIVFERDAALDEFIEPGTLLNATISKELLYSIFIPSFENPMHDGAVIIREGRIWQAGAVLPLTTSPKVDRSHGTRHRAAIGISEETDAVVVVVSEEQGTVGLCFSGNIARRLDATSLRKALLGLFYRRTAGVRPKGPGVSETTGSAVGSGPESSSELRVTDSGSFRTISSGTNAETESTTTGGSRQTAERSAESHDESMTEGHPPDDVKA